ncbi:alpha-ribazole phosphatase [Clostridium sp. CX1]|uniref:Alpha-ribazole phosphatase n=1 Tax=Clostridium tanneri TaxID=3037988 RepID=A0ABU4JXS2_9CLOT|nr:MULTISPECIES: alpha-ribazole phosphatase [unclassified Clostridium]MCT8978528.1 alpha-ribazole phosphatase [Clostridium sp. CX1]MDW8802679.1 alpha-ribazole phosphatase [Clostridium sp. A1-XYC3]
MNKIIYLVRHGKIDTDDKKRYIGFSDILLNEEGVNQGKKLKKFFSEIYIEKIYCSDLSRTRKTAEIISEGRNIEKVELKELREINMGKWENRTFEEIKNKYPKEFENRGKYIKDFTPDGGESFGVFKDRVLNIFKGIVLDTKESTVIVAHAGVNRIILSDILGISLENIFKIKQDYGCINKIIVNQSTTSISTVNYTLSHI